MPITIGVLFVLSFLPARLIKWTDWFSAQVQVAVVPITHPLTIVVDAIVPARISDPNASERERAIINELERVKVELLQTKEEYARLSRLVNLTPDLRVNQIARPRVGNLAGDILLIRTGNVDGLTQGTVVVSDATQLVGRVSRVDRKTAHVLPITAPGAQPIMGTILLDASGDSKVSCLLHPMGNGMLQGDVSQPDLGEQLDIVAGQEVRLYDTLWPSSAQMLMIGEIVSVDRDPEQPLRPQIVVRPTFEDLRRLREVIFRIPDTDDQEGRP